MTLADQQVIDIVNALLDHAGVHASVVDPPRTCQVEHPHWEGPMICGNTLPCPRHGGR